MPTHQPYFFAVLPVDQKINLASPEKKIVWQFDVRSHVTQDLGDTRLI